MPASAPIDLRVTLRETLRIDPARMAIDFQGEAVTWGELGATVDAIDDAAATLGIDRHAAVGCVLRNRPPHVAMLIAILGSDRCVVTLNPLYPNRLLADDIRALRPPLVIAESEDWARPGFRDAVADIGAGGIELTGKRAAPVRIAARPRPRGDHFRADPGVGIYMLTSGTTGTPKRVPLQRLSFARTVADAMAYEKKRADAGPPQLRRGVTLHNSPLVHIAGMFGIVHALMNRRAIALMEKFSVAEWRRAIVTHRPPVASATPSALKMILDADLPREDLASLTLLRSGTAILPPELADAFYDRYGLPVLSTYGATEFPNVAGWNLPDWHAHRLSHRGSVGKVLAGIDARVVDAEEGAVLPFGEEGLLELKAPQFGDGGWIRTTDRVRMDADRFLWILGRQDNVIVRGGFKIHAEQVQTALEEHPDILESAVVGLDDARLGAVPAAAILLRSGALLDEATLRGWARERMLPYQVPVAFRFVDQLPRSASMKPILPAIRALFEPAVAPPEGR